MKIVADTHLHLYPCYDMGRAFACLADNLAVLSEDAGVLLGFMAERHDCDSFSALLNGSVEAGAGWNIQAGADGKSVTVRASGTGDRERPSSSARRPAELCLLPGRQVVTVERLEVLALAMTGSIPDGLPAVEAVEMSIENGGIPVLAWAPGKWFFRRGRIVRDLLDRCDPGSLLIGDTSLRPGIWPEPILMRTAREKGFRVVAGSDPLPFPGEESVMGTYASFLDGSFNSADALNSARELLSSRLPAVPAGRRGGLLRVLLRLWRNARV